MQAEEATARASDTDGLAIMSSWHSGSSPKQGLHNGTAPLSRGALKGLGLKVLRLRLVPALVSTF